MEDNIIAKLGFWIIICTIFIIVTQGITTNILENRIEDRQEIEKRAYKKLTKENKELIEYIVFGETQE
jgi:hypothetical protein